MSASEQIAPPTPGAAEVAERSLLDEVLERGFTPQTERSRAEELLRTLADEALQGTITWDRNVTRTIRAGMEAIDAALSKQLAAIMHHPDFQKLEGTWRGLHYLVQNTETSARLKIRVLNVSKRELFRDLDRAIEFDQSQIFKKVYSSEFDMPGGEPYGALIGDYEITNHPEDVDLLAKMSQVSAAGFCPFLSAASPALFGFQNWTEMSKPRDLERIFDTIEYTKWKAFRESEDSRFTTLVLPRVLSRLPYGAMTRPVEEFNYEEVELEAGGKPKAVPHEHYSWMNAAYVLGARLTDAFARFGFCTAIRGAENGGRVEGLPAHIFLSDDGDLDLKCPTEIGIGDRRENELSKLGFLPLCHYKGTDYAVFFGAQTAQKPKKYDRPDATENAAISARLPYMMATARFAHYLKVMARDWIGSFMEQEDCEARLNRWIQNYVNGSSEAGPEMRATFPLREARVEVHSVPGKPGSYNAKIFLRPWLQLEELTAALSMVTKLPQPVGA
jgi:type VI secretion system protein ImpC